MSDKKKITTSQKTHHFLNIELAWARIIICFYYEFDSGEKNAQAKQKRSTVTTQKKKEEKYLSTQIEIKNDLESVKTNTG